MRKHIVPILENKNSSQFVAHWRNLSEEEAVVVFSNTLPNNPTKFLLHLLLTVGKLDTELDILNVQSFKEAFIEAGILLNSTVTDGAVKEIAKKEIFAGTASLHSRVI